MQQQNREKRRMSVKEVLDIYTDEESAKLIDKGETTRDAIANVEITALSLSTKSTRSPRARKTYRAPTSRAKACSATSCL